MHHATPLVRITALALGVAGALACGHADASAFQLKENSAKAQGRAMAGAASAKGDASVVVNNPALMSTFERTTLQGDVTAVDLSFEFDGSGYAASGTPLQQPLSGGNGGNAGGGEPGFISPDDGVQRLVDPSVSSSRRMRRDLLDPTRDPDRLPPIPESARIGAGEHGFGNNSRFGYDRSGRPR